MLFLNKFYSLIRNRYLDYSKIFIHSEIEMATRIIRILNSMKINIR
jgi:hypothetical protein